MKDPWVLVNLNSTRKSCKENIEKEDSVNLLEDLENIFSFQGQTTVIQDSTKSQQIKISSHRTEEKISYFYNHTF